MRALTVQQPWAWAIIHGGKDVENRTQAWKYRGPLAIHTSQRLDPPALDDPLIDHAWRDRYGWGPARDGLFQAGVVLGVVDLVDVHTSVDCVLDGVMCSPWAESSVRAQRKVVHLLFDNPRSLGFLNPPITCKGRLGLWTPAPSIIDEIREAIR